MPLACEWSCTTFTGFSSGKLCRLGGPREHCFLGERPCFQPLERRDIFSEDYMFVRSPRAKAGLGARKHLQEFVPHYSFGLPLCDVRRLKGGLSEGTCSQ